MRALQTAASGRSGCISGTPLPNAVTRIRESASLRFLRSDDDSTAGGEAASESPKTWNIRSDSGYGSGLKSTPSTTANTVAESATVSEIVPIAVTAYHFERTSVRHARRR